MRIASAGHFVVGALFLAGCSAPAPAQGSFPLTVGPEGGRIEGSAESDLAGVTLEIPPGALEAPTLIEAALVEDEPVLGPTSAAVGPTYRLSPSGLALKKPARFTVPVFSSALGNYEQTTADCAVWLEEGGATWRQAAQVSSTERTVTVETSTLGAGAAGVRFLVVAITTAPLARPCTSPSGFCVTLAGQKLRNSSTQFSNVSPAGKLYYRHNGPVNPSTGFSRTIAEYNVLLGRHDRTSVGFPGPTSRSTSLPNLLELQQRTVLAPDDTVWSPQLSGVMQVPFAGTATAFADTGARTRTAAVLFSPDGKRHRVRLVGGALAPTTLLLTSTAPGASEILPAKELENDPSLGGLDSVSVQVVGAGNSIAYAFPSAPPRIRELLQPPSNQVALPLANAVAGVGANRIDDLAISADGNLFAVSLAQLDQDRRVVIAPRDGGVAVGVGGLPNLSGLEFGFDGALYATAATTAQVFHIDPVTGGVQTVPLTTADAGTPEYASRIPVALRRLVVPTMPPRHVMVAITGTGERQVVLIERTP